MVALPRVVSVALTRVVSIALWRAVSVALSRVVSVALSGVVAFALSRILAFALSRVVALAITAAMAIINRQLVQVIARETDTQIMAMAVLLAWALVPGKRPTLALVAVLVRTSLAKIVGPVRILLDISRKRAGFVHLRLLT